MRITKVDIPEQTEKQDGLEAIKMDKLGKIVLIAGKNGSGKTRILNKIITVLSSKMRKSAVQNIISRIQKHKEDLNSNEKYLSDGKEQLSKQVIEQNKENLRGIIAEYERKVNNDKETIKALELQLNWKQVETSELAENYIPVRFVPKSLNLEDSNSVPNNQIMSLANNVNIVGMENLSRGVYAKIQVIQNRWYNTTHQFSKATENEKEKSIEEYDKLKQIVKDFLGPEIDRNNDGEATLFGFPMAQSKLSNGQIILLQFCLAIYSQETALKDLILILDEPENHLHPSVIIETIDRIVKCVPNGQIWIATHSIPLLAHFDPSKI